MHSSKVVGFVLARVGSGAKLLALLDSLRLSLRSSFRLSTSAGYNIDIPGANS